MNFIKRALLSVKSRLGKTALLLLITTVVCLVVLAGISIQSASKATSILARQKLGSTVTLTADMQKVMEKMREETESSSNENSNGESGRKLFKPTKTPVSLNYLDELKDLEYVKSYNLISDTSVKANDFEAIKSDSDESMQINSQGQDQFRGAEMKESGDISLKGVYSIENADEDLEILDGRSLISEDIGTNVAIIEENLATQDDLKVGDKINVESTSDSSVIVEMEIVGIYKSSEQITEDGFMRASSSPYNKIYVPYTLVNSFKGDDYAEAVDEIVFYLNDPVDTDNFVSEAESTSIDFEKFKLDSNNTAYETMMRPIENIASFSKTALYIVTISGALILSLIIMLSIRERISEVGILLALGEKKTKIICQFVMEMVLVVVIAIGISMLAGKGVSNVVANQLLNQEIQVESTSTSSKENLMPGGNNGMMGGNHNFQSGFNNSSKNVEAITDIDVNVGVEDFGKMSIISLLISIISVIIPSILVMRFNPKEILSKHN